MKRQTIERWREWGGGTNTINVETFIHVIYFNVWPEFSQYIRYILTLYYHFFGEYLLVDVPAAAQCLSLLFAVTLLAIYSCQLLLFVSISRTLFHDVYAFTAPKCAIICNMNINILIFQSNQRIFSVVFIRVFFSLPHFIDWIPRVAVCV